MDFDKPSPLENVNKPNFSAIIKAIFSFFLETDMWLFFFILYTESVSLMKNTYLSDLPLLGTIFLHIDPDANGSHVISILLATFSVGTPVFIYMAVLQHDILSNPREWISSRQNQILAGFAALILMLVIGMEITSMYTLVCQETTSATISFIKNTDGGLMRFLSENKGMAIAISIVIATVNIILAIFSVNAFKSIKTSQEV